MQNANKTSAAIPQPDAVQAVRDERLTVEDGRAAGVPDGRGQITGGVELRLRAKLGAEMVSQPVQHPKRLTIVLLMTCSVVCMGGYSCLLWSLSDGCSIVILFLF